MSRLFPRNTRELFQAFRLYDDEAGIASIVDGLDLSNIRPRHIYYSVLGRLPESRISAVGRSNYDARSHLRAALESQEFQRNVIRFVLQAFPDWKRLIFIHIPKCAGTHLNARLSAHYPTLSASMQDELWTSNSLLFSILHEIIGKSEENKTVLVSGHRPISWYADRSLLRPSDRLFSVVRNPIDLVISNINYILFRLINNPSFSNPDTKLWAETLQISQGDVEPTRECRLTLAKKILYSTDLTLSNFLCQYLGEGTAESAIDTVIRTNIEITDVTRYEEWFVETWNISVGERENVTEKLIGLDDFQPAETTYLNDITYEDEILYQKIVGALNNSARSSVCGEALMNPSWVGFSADGRRPSK